jgi:PhnB protein
MAFINTYLNFSGNTREAFEFYRSVFGGDFGMVMTFGQLPEGVPGHGVPADWIMHISLPIGRGTILMGSDAPEAFGPLVRGNAYSVMLGADTLEEGNRLFAGLSAGGTVTMPFEPAFWGSVFGMFTDKFGVSWMVSFDPKA